MRGLLIVLALVGLIGGGGYAVREYAPQYLPDQWTTDAVLTQRLRAELGKDERVDAFFARLEQLFPADYSEMMAQLVVIYRRNGTAEQAATFTERYMSSFVADNQRHVQAAEPAVLIELARAIADAMAVLREEEPLACGEIVRRGPGFSPEFEDASPATKSALIRVTIAMLESIASGKRAPTQYAAPTQVQLQALFDRYEASGGDMRALELSARDPSMLSLSSEEVCMMSESMWRAALQAEDDFVPRFVSTTMGGG